MTVSDFISSVFHLTDHLKATDHIPAETKAHLEQLTEAIDIEDD
jgi:hypothetical protein